MPATVLLLLSAAGIALIHTLAGPDHYLPFAGMARAFSWSRRRTIAITLGCGAAHVLSSALLGLVGIALGLGISRLEAIESARAQYAAWALTAFGLLYAAWGLRRAARCRPHSHVHVHDGGDAHSHAHVHEHGHLHVHAGSRGATPGLVPWMLFAVFLLGPCEPLIPLVMFPAAGRDWVGVVLVTVVFGFVTILTMVAAVLACAAGMHRFRIARLERYSHAFAGGMIGLCGISVLLLQL